MVKEAPSSWVKFGTLKPGDKFHDCIDPGQPTQFVKMYGSGNWAANLDTGVNSYHSDDEFVYPIDAGWIAELACYGFKISDELKAKGHRDILAYVFSQTEARKANDHWRKEIEKYLPQFGVMSFSGAERIIRWLFERVTINKDDNALARELKAIEESPGLTDDEKIRSRLETLFPNLRGNANVESKDNPVSDM